MHQERCERWRGAGVPSSCDGACWRCAATIGGSRWSAPVVVEGATLEAELAQLLARSDVDFVHARFARPGCFACRIERAPE